MYDDVVSPHCGGVAVGLVGLLDSSVLIAKT